MMRITVLFLAGAVAASAQFPIPGMSGRSSSSDSQIEVASPLPAFTPPRSFRGAVPQGAASDQPLNLSLAEAVRLGLERNLGTVISSAGQRAARGERLIAARADFEKAKLNLSQAIGIPGGQQLNLTDELAFDPLADLPEEAVIEQAYQQRSDYRSQAARVRATELQRKGIRSVRLPSLSLDGDYGVLGSSPASSHGTYSVSVGLDIPIFAGGAERGAMIRADAELDRQQAQLDELRSRIGFEVRAALLDLNSAKEQVAVSGGALDLAQQQVTHAGDRFAAGVTDTLEVVQAQQGLAAANESYIAGLFAYNLAKVQLARALGGTERNLAQWAAQGSQR